MQIQILLFSILRQKAGQGQLTVELPDGACVADARDAAARALPAIESDLGRVAWAANMEFVPLDHPLKQGDELAAIPPVSGG